jgi:hypothetical protein
VLAAASFKAARTLSHDEVMSFVRQPFVRGHAKAAARNPSAAGWSRRSANSPRARAASARGQQRGWRPPRSLAPRFGRLLTWSLGAAAVNDFLQAGFAAITAKANEVEEHTG